MVMGMGMGMRGTDQIAREIVPPRTRVWVSAPIVAAVEEEEEEMISLCMSMCWGGSGALVLCSVHTKISLRNYEWSKRQNCTEGQTESQSHDRLEPILLWRNFGESRWI